MSTSVTIRIVIIILVTTNIVITSRTTKREAEKTRRAEERLVTDFDLEFMTFRSQAVPRSSSWPGLGSFLNCPTAKKGVLFIPG